MEWYLKVVRDNYANFEGRARRKEYWMFVLYNALFGFALYMIVLLGLMAENSLLMGIGTALLVIYAVAIFIPSLAVCIRRLHDTNNSGWMYLIQFIPLIGVFWLLYLFVKEGDQGSNQYGSDPKEESGDAFANQWPSESSNTQNHEPDNNNTF